MKKQLFLFVLIHSALFTYGMEKENKSDKEPIISTEQAERSSVNDPLESPAHIFPNLKTICIITILQKITSGEFDKSSLDMLPEEVREIYNLYENIYHIYTLLKVKAVDKAQLGQVEKIYHLLIELVKTESPYLKLGIEAIEQFLRQDIDNLISKKELDNNLAVACVVLNVVLNPHNLPSIIGKFIVEEHPTEEKISNTMVDFLNLIIRQNVTRLMELVVQLNILSNKQYTTLFYNLCFFNASQEMISTVILNLNNKTTYKTLVDDDCLYYLTSREINIIKLFFEKLELFDFDIKEIINTSNYYMWNTLLNKAVNQAINPELVEFLLSKGADPSNQDALSWAISTYENVHEYEVFYKHIPSSTKILQLIIQALLLNQNEANDKI